MRRVQPLQAIPIAVAILVLGALGQSPSSRKTAPQNERPDPALCARCHESIAATFRNTGMARSFYRATPENLADLVKSSKPFFHAASHTYFETLERGGKLYQRR